MKMSLVLISCEGKERYKTKENTHLACTCSKKLVSSENKWELLQDITRKGKHLAENN